MNTELVQKTNQLQKGILEAMKKRNYAKVANLQAQLNELQWERTSLQQAALESLTTEEHLTAIRTMNRLFVLGDLIEDAATDLESFMRKTGVRHIDICDWAATIKHTSAKFAKMVDSFHDENFSDSFGELCDTVKLAIENAFYKHEAIIRDNVEQSRASYENNRERAD